MHLLERWQEIRTIQNRLGQQTLTGTIIDTHVLNPQKRVGFAAQWTWCSSGNKLWSDP